jgi:hypothetical protein
MERDIVLKQIFYKLRKELGRNPSQIEILEKIRGRKNP